MTLPQSARVRPATIRDSGALAEIGAASFAETYATLLPPHAISVHCATHHSTAAWRDLLAAPASAGWIAERGSQVIGYALMTAPDIPGAKAGDMELRRIYTLAVVHGTGAGASLLDAVITAARAAGAFRLLVGVLVHNHRARAFYHRAGFSRIGTRTFMVGDVACDDLVLALPLALCWSAP